MYKIQVVEYWHSPLAGTRYKVQPFSYINRQFRIQCIYKSLQPIFDDSELSLCDKINQVNDLMSQASTLDSGWFRFVDTMIGANHQGK